MVSRESLVLCDIFKAKTNKDNNRHEITKAHKSLMAKIVPFSVILSDSWLSLTYGIQDDLLRLDSIRAKG